MKNIIRILVLLTIVSCSNHKHEEIKLLRAEFKKLRNDNDSLSNNLDSIKINFIQPFEQYQQVLRTEREMSPDSIIHQYEKLINTFPNSLWAHEAKKRINNINERRRLWYDGEWHLEKDIRIELGVISCPGC